MRKEIKKIKGDIVQITTQSERWYQRGENEFVPSVTWITQFYPKGIAYYKWLASKGWDEAEAIKIAAGDKGSKVHQAIEELLKGEKVKMEAKFLNKTSGELEELTLEEYEALMSFVDWFNAVNPKMLASEITVFSKKFNYAGTVDFICEIDKQIYIVDFKTSQYIWPSHELQLSAYSKADFEQSFAQKWINRKLAILQLGYRFNKRNWKFTEIKDKFQLFLAARKIWENECANIKPFQRDYPLELKLEIKK